MTWRNPSANNVLAGSSLLARLERVSARCCGLDTQPRILDGLKRQVSPWARRLCLLAVLVWNPLLPEARPSVCPKILMFDGLDVLTELDEAKAKYWGQVVGVDGFFLNHVMADWTDSVGDDEGGETFRRVRKFQELHSKFGVSDNFIKVAVYKQHDWRDPDAQSRVVSNFRQAAHLARYAGLKGLALDLEDYVGGHWANDPTVPDKADRVYSLGRRIGGAILSDFPDSEIIVLPEVLASTCPPYSEKVCQNYALCGASGMAWSRQISGSSSLPLSNRMIRASRT